MKLSLTLVLLSCIGLIGGCSTPLVVGQSTEADVRARMGAPGDTRVEPNGDRVWEYPTGPEGHLTHMVRIGSDGKVKEVSQLLSEEQLGKVVPGQMTRSDVRKLLGRPSFDHQYRVGQTWSWRYYRGDIQPGWLVVTFSPDGTVKDKYVVIDLPGDARDK